VIVYVIMAAADSELVVPGGMILTAASLFALGMRTYKESRNIDVAGERTRRIAAEEREKATEGGLQAKLQPLKDEIAELKAEIQAMRREQAADREQHDKDMDRLRDQLVQERAKVFAFRTYFTDNGLPIPEGLGPA
jgi:TolA-binding protein